MVSAGEKSPTEWDKESETGGKMGGEWNGAREGLPWDERVSLEAILGENIPGKREQSHAKSLKLEHARRSIVAGASFAHRGHKGQTLQNLLV